MKPITSGQVRRFLELTEEVDRDTFQKRLDDPSMLVGFLKTGRLEECRVGKLATIREAKKLGYLVIGPKEVNGIFGTTLDLADCPLGFTKDQLYAFAAQAKNDFDDSDPPIALILFVRTDGMGKPINLLYLREKFNTRLVDNWYVDQPGVIFSYQQTALMWALTFIKTNPVYINKDWEEQQEKAMQRQEQFFSATDEAYSQLVVEAITRQIGKVPFYSRTTSLHNNEPVLVGGPHNGIGITCTYGPKARVESVGAAVAKISEIET